MKDHRPSILAAVVLLALSMLACQVGGSLPDPGQVATSVAQTVAAALPSPGAPTPPPADVPTPTSEPLAPTPPPPAVARALAVDAGGNLWFWQEGISPRQLTSSGQVVDSYLSDDGLVAVFLRTADYARYSLWSVNTDGSGEREQLTQDGLADLGRVPDAIGGGVVYGAWVPGTHTFAFATHPTFEGPGLLINNDLYLLDVDSNNLRELLPRGQGGRFAYSPDGSQIAISTAETISLVNADGSNRRDSLVTFPFINTASEYAYYPFFHWAPDSSFVLTFIPPIDPWLTPPAPTAIWKVFANGSPAVNLSSVSSSFLGALVFSPDATRMLYQVQTGVPEANTYEVHFANVDGSGDTNYATVSNPSLVGWSADAAYFLYSVQDSDAQLGQPGTAPAVQPGTLTARRSLLWKDATHFLYVSPVGGGSQIRQRSVGGEDVLLATLSTELAWLYIGR